MRLNELDSRRAAAFACLLGALNRLEVDEARFHIATLAELGLAVEPMASILERRQRRNQAAAITTPDLQVVK
ncbi:hypothetical protein NZK35_07780 [Stieleria sp. ICT_E10.1]|uniref:hypothetical protein n=1 Tax=Stieleria sedimenti TaxID=2976331 RepID=UPI0021804343|nr:hypothetical protein [Stieleria sedimenti]MCS7466540.1 hypothetical protein [Stieleria sedimenti]